MGYAPLTQNIRLGLESPVRDQHSSLLINYVCKKFYNIGPRKGKGKEVVKPGGIDYEIPTSAVSQAQVTGKQV